MKRILVPVDFSPNSKKAFRFAVDMASNSGGSIFLYHLFRPLKASEAGVPFDTREHNLELKAINLKRLQRLKKKVLADSNKNVPVSEIIGRIPVVKNILQFARQNQIELIVMGTKGATGLRKITIGSNASKVMERSATPVLLIPEKFVWKKPEKILFTTTIHKSDNEVFPILLDLATLYDAEITVVNLRDRHQLYGFKEKEEFEMYAYSMQRTFDEAKIKFTQLDTFSVEKTMENLYEKIPFDMLVMSGTKKSFLQKIFTSSFTKSMALIAERPLLIIPQTKEVKEISIRKKVKKAER